VKKIFGKNQVIITALAVMIAVAGYLSVTQDTAKQVSNMGENTDGINTDGINTMEPEVLSSDNGQQQNDVAEVDENTIYDISDADIEAVEEYRLSDTGEIISEEPQESVGEQPQQTQTDNTGEAVLVSSTIGSQYFDAAKLSREQTRSKNKEILMELVNSEATTQEQKDKAVGEVIELTSNFEKETAAETMLEAKGYGECIVNIVDGKADVIVNANNLSEKEIAQIEDVVKRKTDIEAKNIVITPVGVTE